MKGYCNKCEELRSDNGEDAWGFIWNASVPQCQRCGSAVELRNDAEDNEETEDIEYNNNEAEE